MKKKVLFLLDPYHSPITNERFLLLSPIAIFVKTAWNTMYIIGGNKQSIKAIIGKGILWNLLKKHDKGLTYITQTF